MSGCTLLKRKKRKKSQSQASGGSQKTARGQRKESVSDEAAAAGDDSGASAAPAPAEAEAGCLALAPLSHDKLEALKRKCASATFDVFRLSDWLVDSCAALGMTRPTPVQISCIPAIIDGQ